MRVRRVVVLVCAASLAAACTNVSPSPDPKQSTTRTATSLKDVVIEPPKVEASPATGPLPAPVVPVGIYIVAWQKALQGLASFDPAVGVASLETAEELEPLCADKTLQFDVYGAAVLYCRTAQEGPDAFPQPGMIVVPYRLYKKVAQDSSLDKTAVNQGTALLMAAGYTRHVLAELPNDTPEAEALQQQANCVAGVTLAAYIFAIDDAQWEGVWSFVENFTVIGAPGWKPEEIEAGYRSRRLETCLE